MDLGRLGERFVLVWTGCASNAAILACERGVGRFVLGCATFIGRIYVQRSRIMVRLLLGLIARTFHM